MNQRVQSFREHYPGLTENYTDEQITLLLGNYNRDNREYMESDPKFLEDYRRLKREYAPGLLTEMGRAASSGIDRAQAALWGAGGALADLVGWEDARAYAEEAIRKNQHEAAKARGSVTVANWDEVDSVGDFFRWAPVTFAENVPQLGATVAGTVGGGLIGGAVGGPPGAVAGGVAGAAGTSIPMNVGDMYADLITSEDPQTRERAARTALTYGTGAGLIDAIGALAGPGGSAVSKFIPEGRIVASVMGVLAKADRASGVKGAALGLIKDGLSEGITEGVQEAISIAGEEYATGRPIPAEVAWARIRNSMAAGAVVGGPLGGVIGAIPGRRHLPAASEETRGEPVEATTTPPPEATAAVVPAVVAEPPEEPIPLSQPVPLTLPERVVVAPDADIPPAPAIVPEPPTQEQQATELLQAAHESPRRRTDYLDEIYQAIRETGTEPVSAAREAIAYTSQETDPLENLRRVAGGQKIGARPSRVFPSYTDTNGNFIPGRRVPAYSGFGDSARAQTVLDKLKLPAAEATTPSEQAESERVDRGNALLADLPAITTRATSPGFAIVDFGAKTLPSVKSTAATESTTGRDALKGRTAIALEKDGIVQVRNVYKGRGKLWVENADTLGIQSPSGGAALDRVLASGYQVAADPFTLSQPMTALNVAMPRAEWESFIEASRDFQDAVLHAGDSGQPGAVFESALQASDPNQASAVDTLISMADAESPQAMRAGMGKSVDSLRATARRLGKADELLTRDKEGRVFGLFTDEQWQSLVESANSAEGLVAFPESVYSIIGEDGPQRFQAWARNIAQYGENRLRGLNRRGQAAYSPDATIEDAVEVVAEDAAPELVDAKDLERVPKSETEIRQALITENGLSSPEVDFILGELEESTDITSDLTDVLTYNQKDLASYIGFVESLSSPERRRQIASITSRIQALHDQRNNQRYSGDVRPGQEGVDGGAQDPEQAGLPGDRGTSESVGSEPTTAASVGEPELVEATARARAAIDQLFSELGEGEDARFSQPTTNSEWRATNPQVQAAFSQVIQSLAAFGTEVEAILSSLPQGWTSGDGRLVRLWLKDITAPTAIDLRVAVHESVHALFSRLPASTQAAIHRAVRRMSDEDLGISDAQNRSIDEARNPEELAEERLAVSFEAEGIDATEARSLASRIWRAIKAVYLQLASSILRSFGYEAHADAMSLRYFHNRLQQMLRGEIQPQSLLEFVGGPPPADTDFISLLKENGDVTDPLRVKNGGLYIIPLSALSETGIRAQIRAAASNTLARDATDQVAFLVKWATDRSVTLDALAADPDQFNEAANAWRMSHPRFSRPKKNVGKPSPFVQKVDNADQARIEDASRAVLGRSPERVSSSPPGPEGSPEQLAKRAIEWAHRNGLEASPAEFRSRWIAQGKLGGSEHAVYHRDGRWHKKADLSANLDNSWARFLERIALHNRFFPDAPIRIEGVFPDAAPLISQPDIPSDPKYLRPEDDEGGDGFDSGYELDPLEDDASNAFRVGWAAGKELRERVDADMEERGFIQDADGEGFYYHSETGAMVSDLHQNNVAVGPGNRVYIFDPSIWYARDEDMLGFDAGRYSRPVLDPMGALENPANMANLHIASARHQAQVENALVEALSQDVDVAEQVRNRNSARARQGLPPQDLIEWIRSEFNLPDPGSLIRAALETIDPTTGKPVAANENADIDSFKHKANQGRARLIAFQALRQKVDRVRGYLSRARTSIDSVEAKRLSRTERFARAHRDYLSVDGLASEIQRGTRSMIARERTAIGRLNRKIGIVSQQLRALGEDPLNPEYSKVFQKLFTGGELSGRKLFDYLDKLVNDAEVDFTGPVSAIREAVDARRNDPDIEPIAGANRTSRALLATVIAYAKTNRTVLGKIEQRRLKSAQERLDLQKKLDELLQESEVSASVGALGKAARLEERLKRAYIAERRSLATLERREKELRRRVALAEKILPVMESQQRQLGEWFKLRPDISFSEGLEYRIPLRADASVDQMQAATLRLHGPEATKRETLREQLRLMTEWLGARETRANTGDTNAFDADYYAMRAQRDALSSGAFVKDDLRKVDHWSRSLIFQSVIERLDSLGIPMARQASQLVSKFTAQVQRLRNPTESLATRSERARDRVLAVLNRGVEQKLDANTYYNHVLDPSKSIWEKETGLLELGLTDDALEARMYRKILNHLNRTPGLSQYIEGKESEFLRALKEHIDAEESASSFYNRENERNGLGVSDDLLVATSLSGKETEGIRDSLPIGAKTFSRRINVRVLGPLHAAMKSKHWPEFRDMLKGGEGRPSFLELLEQDPNAARASVLAYFDDPTIQRHFFEAVAENDSISMFDAPVLEDGQTKPEADPFKIRTAWEASQGDPIAFAKIAYELHDGQTGESAYVAEVMQRFAELYDEMANVLGVAEPQATGKTNATVSTFKGMVANAMIDARSLRRWPTAWSEYLVYDRDSVHSLNSRVAAQIAFGREGRDLDQAFLGIRHELDAAEAKLRSAEDQAARDTLGLKGKELDKKVASIIGDDEFKRLRNLRSRASLLDASAKGIQDYFHRNTQGVMGALKLPAQAINTLAFMILQQPASALLQMTELFSPIIQGGLSKATLKQTARTWKYAFEDLAGSFLQATGSQAMQSSRLHRAYVDEGYQDAHIHRQFLDFTLDKGGRDSENGRSLATQILREIPLTLQGLQLNFVGDGAAFNTLRPLAMFSQATQITNKAIVLGAWARMEDLVKQGIDFMQSNPAKEDPDYQIRAEDLGLSGGEARAHDEFITSIMDRYGLDYTSMVRAAMERGGDSNTPSLLLDSKARSLLASMALSEISLEGNLSTTAPGAFTSPILRLVLPLWGWPIRRLFQVARTRKTPQGAQSWATVGRGLLALAVVGAGSLAWGMLIDEYHERILGKARNLRSMKGILDAPNAGEVGMTLLENVNRVGLFGLGGELVNTMVNVAANEGDNRGVSLDRRIVFMSALLNVHRAVSSLIAQDGTLEYNSVIRPFVSAIGGNGMLQMTQIANRALMAADMDPLLEAEARTVSRINAQNILRVSGRTNELEVRSGAGGYAQATPMSPRMTRIEMAIYANDRAGFQKAYQEAVQYLVHNRRMQLDEAEKWVKQSLLARHPLRKVFRSITESEYSKLLRGLNPGWRNDVSEAVRYFNTYGSSIGIKPFMGKPLSDNKTASRKPNRPSFVL